MVMDKTQSSENYSNFYAYRKAQAAQSAELQFAALANPKGLRGNYFYYPSGTE